MAPYSPSEQLPEMGEPSLHKGRENLQPAASSPQGMMRDIELSSRKVPVEGIFGYMKPLFSLSDGEFGQRCISCAMSYLCLDMTFARLLDVSLSEMSVQCGHIVDQIGMPSFFGEESLDVSTASAPGTHLPVTESPNRTFNSGARDAYANNYEDPQMGVIGGGSIEGSHLGALEGHCNKNHPFFVTMRRMWSSPDLYAVFWINMFLGGYIFIKQAFVKHLYETVAPILSLSLMAKLIMLCWLCSILMSVGITICRSVAVGVLDKNSLGRIDSSDLVEFGVHVLHTSDDNTTVAFTDDHIPVFLCFHCISCGDICSGTAGQGQGLNLQSFERIGSLRDTLYLLLLAAELHMKNQVTH
ncbi:hypothetical protein BgAZ_110920 [Babesia gibsoni]|uniref:Uncharacterized protein n=1 Tax=Babesia gibsoni TaxID=33632 RepID=A0AAD8PGX7_BABGI|nr:hypothetical protein BgAZ_110920 [Babesia gibsoni]